MSLRPAGQSAPVRPISDGGYDSVQRLGERQVDAIYSATGQPGEDVFLPAPAFPVERRIARAIGLGRNIDAYA